MRSEIPEGWKNMRVYDLFYLDRENIMPNLHPESSFVHFSIPAFDEKKEPDISLGKKIESNKYKIGHDSILLSKLNPRIKRLWLVKTSEKFSKYEAMVCSTEFIPLVPKKELDLLFYYYYMSLDIFYDLVKRNAEGTTNSRQRMKPEEILGFNILEPPIKEQQKIATILQSLDNVINKTKELIEKHKKMKQGLMQELFAKGVDKNGSLRKEVIWNKVQIRSVAFAADIDHKMPEDVDFGVPFISAKDITEAGEIILQGVKQISEQDYKRLSRKIEPQEGDIIYSRIGTIGRAALVKNNRKFLMSYSCCVIRKTNDKIEPSYLFHILRSRMIEEQILRETQSIGVPDLGLDKIHSFEILLPKDKGEQRRIARRLDAFDHKVKAEQSYLEKLTKIKAGLMQDLLTGKVRVND